MIHQRFTCRKRYYKINYERLAKQKQGGKKKDKQYCEDNIEKLQKKAWQGYRKLSDEEKNQK